MNIDFNGIIDLEIPSDDELLEVYERVKAQMDEEASYNLLVEIGKTPKQWKRQRVQRDHLKSGQR